MVYDNKYIYQQLNKLLIRHMTIYHYTLQFAIYNETY